MPYFRLIKTQTTGFPNCSRFVLENFRKQKQRMAFLLIFCSCNEPHHTICDCFKCQWILYNLFAARWRARKTWPSWCDFEWRRRWQEASKCSSTFSFITKFRLFFRNFALNAFTHTHINVHTHSTLQCISSAASNKWVSTWWNRRLTFVCTNTHAYKSLQIYQQQVHMQVCM